MYECRICQSIDEEEHLITPCDCKGSLRYVHRDCLLDWISYKLNKSNCELCGAPFLLLRWKMKPFLSFRLPPLSFEEKAKFQVALISILIGAVDIGYSIKHVLRHCPNLQTRRRTLLLNFILLLLTSGSWLYIFSQNNRFFYVLWRRLIEYNSYFTLLDAPSSPSPSS